MSDKGLVGLNEAHKRGISATLTVMDQALCEMDAWANGREVVSVFYRERNTLTPEQRSRILAEVERLRAILAEVKSALQLTGTTEDAGSAILSRSAVLWTYSVELRASHLRRYGELPAGLAEYINPLTNSLIEGLKGIADTVRGSSGESREEGRSKE